MTLYPPHNIHTTPVNPANAGTSVKDRLIDMIHSHPDLPALGSSISRIFLRTSSDGQSLEQLTSFILTDPSVTLKILRLANSVAYRATARAITSISKAIQLIGMNTVKECALAMVIVDDMPKKHARAVRTELMIAMSASLIGRNLAKRSAFPNAEEVIVAALFKNMGRLVLAAYDDELYRATMRLVTERGYTESKASMEKLGCTLSGLTEFALRAWHIPDPIIQAVKLMPGRILKAPQSRTEWMQQVTEFSNSAALMALNDTESWTDPKIEELLERFGNALEIDTAKLQNIMGESAEQFRSINTGNGAMQHDDEAQHDAMNADLSAEHHEKDESAVITGDAGSWTDRKADCGNNHKPANAADLLLDGVLEVAELLASQHYTINTLLMKVLETYYRSLGFQFVTICVRDLQTHQFQAKNSVGFNHDEIQKGFVFPDSASSDLFSIALKRNIDLAISDAAESKIRNALPEWHKQLLPDTRSFMFLPLVLQNQPVGLIYADRPVVASESITAGEIKLIKVLKLNLLAALHT